jgi:phosphotransferase system  glucose/maltose/N-acetylglucosamine-specific IIC component
MPTIGEIIKTILNEAKTAVKEYLSETETAVKQKIKKLLIISIVSAVLLSVGISLIGAASLFLLIGSLKYLSLFMPQWEAWFIIGITAIVAAVAIFVSLFFIIKKQLSTPKKASQTNVGDKKAEEKTEPLTAK